LLGWLIAASDGAVQRNDGSDKAKPTQAWLAFFNTYSFVQSSSDDAS